MRIWCQSGRAELRWLHLFNIYNMSILKLLNPSTPPLEKKINKSSKQPFWFPSILPSLILLPPKLHINLGHPIVNSLSNFKPRPGSCCLFQASAAPPGRIASTKRPRLTAIFGVAMVNWGDWRLAEKFGSLEVHRYFSKKNVQICFPSGWFAPDETSKPKSVLSAFQAQH